MLRDIATSLVSVVILLFSLTALFGFFLRWMHQRHTKFHSVMIGAVFGTFGIINLAYAFELVPGVVLDLRSPLVIVAGIYGGGIGAFLSAILIILYRVFVVGGAGALGGSLAIFSVAAFATWAHHRFRKPDSLHWLLLGFTSVFISVFWGLVTLSPELRYLFLANFFPTAVVFYPLLTMLLGLLIDHEYEHLVTIRSLYISEQRFRAIFDQAFQFNGLLQPDGILIEANQTALKFAGVQAADVVGKPFWETPWWSFSDDSQQQLQQSIVEASNGNFVRYRVDVIGHDRRVITIDFSLTPVFDQNQQVVLIIPEGRDVTGEILLEQRRIALSVEQERNAILREFITDAAHHLRTPITILRTSHHLLDKTLGQTQQQINHLRSAIEEANPAEIERLLDQLEATVQQYDRRKQRIELNLNSLQSFIEDLLVLARLDQLDTLMIEPTNITALLKDLCDSYHSLIETRNIQFQLQLPPSIIVDADPSRLRIVFQNLLDNAFRYTAAGGQVTVTCEARENTAIIQVADTGIGIPENAQNRIFERFYRAANAQSYSSSGTGLGLAIVHKIIQRHNGTIILESVPDQGTTFTVTLPLAS